MPTEHDHGAGAGHRLEAFPLACPRAGAWVTGQSRARRVLPLRSQAFRILMVGSSISMLGTRISTLAFPMLVLKVKGSPFIAGVVAFAAIAPGVLLYMPAGAIVDRRDPRHVMLASEIPRGAAPYLHRLMDRDMVGSRKATAEGQGGYGVRQTQLADAGVLREPTDRFAAFVAPEVQETEQSYEHFPMEAMTALQDPCHCNPIPITGTIARCSTVCKAQNGHERRINDKDESFSRVPIGDKWHMRMCHLAFRRVDTCCGAQPWLGAIRLERLLTELIVAQSAPSEGGGEIHAPRNHIDIADRCLQRSLCAVIAPTPHQYADDAAVSAHTRAYGRGTDDRE